MAATSMSRIVVPSLALVAACGAALIFGIKHIRREPPVETSAAITAPTVSSPASSDRDEKSAALATAQADVNAVAAQLAVSPPPPVTDESVPVFDIARIERRATQSSLAGQPRARLWNCCETASVLMERPQIDLDNSLWSLPACLLGITS